MDIVTKWIKVSIPHRLSFPRRSRKGRTNRTAVVTVSLPPEVLIIVIEHFQSDLDISVDSLASFYQTPWSFRYGPDYAAGQLRARRSAFYQISLVCRSWRAATTKLFYSHPVLLTPTELQYFRRTITEVPTLARYVTKIAIVIPESLMTSTETKVLGWKRTKVDHLARVKLDASFILRTCFNIDTLSLRQTPDVSRTFTEGFLSLGPVRDNLRKLTIHGTTYIHCLSFDAFPNLQILILKLFQFGHSVRWPNFPRLHTLKLDQTQGWPSREPDDFLLSKENFPSLRELHLYHNSINSGHFGHKIQEQAMQFPRVRSLHLFGPNEGEALFPLTKSGVLDQLQHIVLGNLHSLFPAIAAWVIPESLESLVILVSLTEFPVASPLRVLCACIGLNEARLRSGTASLRRIIVFVFWEPGSELTSDSEESVDIRMEQLRIICDSLDIQVDFHILCGYPFEYSSDI
ncbi:hypothetical protein NLI96_g634 [Meripilus lineatus]|uniref:F-box domain-containing protein n=1 Tax=Meripilus lineatus TaxID=2056292 RepID=A0AAD5YJ39_9APHY|nr:hypothetical protein NLI96_g634 [Physisporinus lineatus]